HNNKLVCVEYPGFVKNVDKMLATLGGEETVSKIHSDPSRRLELRYKPNNPYCHAACGNRYATTSLLLKVVKKTKKSDPSYVEYKSEILGSVETTYRFQGLADYQYLPVQKDEHGEMMSLKPTLLVDKMESSDVVLGRNVPLFIPPPSFSRIDVPLDYYYRPDQHRDVTRPSNLIGIARARRPHNAVFMNFDDKDVPTKPLDAAVAAMKKISDHVKEVEIRELFKKRPIWSKNALKCNLDIQGEKMKILLPVFAYYCVTGPWRSLWVRFGYDPRKDWESVRYQVLDFRLRQSATAAELPVKAKRSTFNYALPLSIHRPGPQVVQVKDFVETKHIDDGSEIPAEDEGKVTDKNKLQYIFQDGSLPPYRQMFYQFDDIQNDRLQDIIASNVQTEQCDEKEGWCKPETLNKLRDLMSEMVKLTVKGTSND
ncbi:general transcription factor 3C polypeptide 5-like, partial [Glandiceps talaboti]